MWYTENSNAVQSGNADCLQQKTGSCQIMKFKTKLAITFLTIILLPVLLSLCAFLGIGTVMMRSGGQTTYGEGMRAYSMIARNISSRNVLENILVIRVTINALPSVPSAN